MDSKTRYVLTLYDNGRKVGQHTSQFRDTLEQQQRQWDQTSDTHSSEIDAETILQEERIGEVAPGEYLTQSLHHFRTEA